MIPKTLWLVQEIIPAVAASTNLSEGYGGTQEGWLHYKPITPPTSMLSLFP